MLIKIDERVSALAEGLAYFVEGFILDVWRHMYLFIKIQLQLILDAFLCIEQDVETMFAQGLGSIDVSHLDATVLEPDKLRHL